MAMADLMFAETLLALETVALRPRGFFTGPALEGEDTVLKHWLRNYQGVVLL